MENTSVAADEVYNHGMALNPQNDKVQCNYCGKVVEGFEHLMKHLAGLRGGQTPACRVVPANVKRLFRGELDESCADNLTTHQVGEILNPISPQAMVIGLKRERVEAGGGAPSVGLPTSSPKGKSVKRGKVEGGQKNDELISVPILSSESVPCPNFETQPLERITVGREVCDSSSPIIIMSTKRKVGRFFFENVIDPTTVESPSFQNMMTALVANQRDTRSCIPSYEELTGWILADELKEVQDYVDVIKASWEKTGCSILMDGWIDDKGRNLVNIVVDCPLGPIYLRSLDVSDVTEDVDGMVVEIEEVISEVGIKNVIQIICHRTSKCLDAVGERIIEKHRNLFWAVSATYCISTMLEKIGVIDSVKDILDKAKRITRFIYTNEAALGIMRSHIESSDLVKSSYFKAAIPFLTLENMLMEMKNLRNMVSSSAWLESPWASEIEAIRVANLLGDKSFMTGLTRVVRATIPLVRVLTLINGDRKPRTGFIYEIMDQVKETICDELGKKQSHYLPFWKIIDEIWNRDLHSPLHAAGYFLNPCFHYTEDFFADPEVNGGFLVALIRLVPDTKIQDMITLQLEAYRACKGGFKKGTERKQHETLPPAAWWSAFGNQCPDLQKLAIKVLSLTCNGAESYGLRRDMAEKLLSCCAKNHKQLRDLSYVHYNLHLKNWKMGENFGNHARQDNLMNDWVTDQERKVRMV